MKPDYNDLDSSRKINDPDNYKWGIFYFNRKDSRIIIPKQDRLRGFTINLANPYTYLTFLGIIAVLIIAKYLL